MNKNFNVILDIDETMISAYPTEELDIENPKIKAKSVKFTLHNMDDYYVVFERPNLQHFLDYVFANFNVSIWSAASKDYVLYVIQNIILTKPKRKLDYILYSYHCSVSKKIKKTSKSLRLLFDTFKLPNYTISNTIIIDDLNAVCNVQKCNCINIKAFKMLDDDSEKDKELKILIDKLKKFKKVYSELKGRACLTKLLSTL